MIVLHKRLRKIGLVFGRLRKTKRWRISWYLECTPEGLPVRNTDAHLHSVTLCHEDSIYEYDKNEVDLSWAWHAARLTGHLVKAQSHLDSDGIWSKTPLATRPAGAPDPPLSVCPRCLLTQMPAPSPPALLRCEGATGPVRPGYPGRRPTHVEVPSKPKPPH